MILVRKFESRADGAIADGLGAGSDAQSHGPDVETSDLSGLAFSHILREEKCIKQLRFARKLSDWAMWWRVTLSVTHLFPACSRRGVDIRCTRTSVPRDAFYKPSGA